MISITGNELRRKYLEFFQSKEHLIMNSFSLVPQDDPSLLLIGAGMAPLKPYFTGKVVPPSYRVTTCQKCIRTGDIENVGRTARHHTFFEMLGNFSFGNYFKKEAISWAWEFLTEVLELDPARLYVTVYPEDQEAYDLWHDMIGLPEEKIFRLEDNFWEIGEGPCGPDSEIFYDLGPERGCGSPTCTVGCDCDRYLEIWNLVFTQFNKEADGTYTPLEKKNIDTGAGLERLASVLQEKPSNFETDLMFPIIERSAELANVTYGTDPEKDVSLKVIGDHIRAIVMMISDGILPSNEGRGYVLRRILRRAVRHGRLLGIEGAFLTGLVDVVVGMFADGYPDLTEKQSYIKKVVANEEARFNQTLAQGLDLLQDIVQQAKQENKTQIAGADVFKLYDTFGFPWELTEEIVHEAGLDIDMDGFNAAMEEQRTRARAAREDAAALVVTPDTTHLDLSVLRDDESVTETEIVMIGKDGKETEAAHDGESVIVILKTTPFHAEGGGQLGDTGSIRAELGGMTVEDTKKLANGLTYLTGTVTDGEIRKGEKVRVDVDIKRRNSMARNHTATHLLQAALRRVLGDHVNQAGSLVMPERLRFDFTHFSPVTDAELNEVSKLVNAEILKAIPVEIQEMSMDAAKEKGATALFGEKYGEVVRVVSVDDFSCELCGGSHVANSAMIGSFRILSESGIGSGVRRIEAVTGLEALRMAEAEREALREVAQLLKVKPDPKQIVEKVQAHLAAEKETEKELQKFKKMQAMTGLDSILVSKETVSGFDVVVAKINAESMEQLREIADEARNKIGSGVVLLGMAAEDKVNFVCMATKDAVAKGIHAGKIVKAAAQEVGGNGGGRPDMAQAGGKEPAHIQKALAMGKKTIAELIG